VDEHIPVLVDEVLEVLAPSAAGFFVDGTFGRGGHSARLLEAVGPDGGILALDRDPDAIAAGRRRFAAEPRLELVQGEFASLAAIVAEHGHGRPVRGVLLDLGVSSPQLDEPELGEERFGRRIAATIVAARTATPLVRTAQLADIVQRAVRTRDGKHPATRTFQAIRMFINDELGQLRRALEGALAVLAPGGRLAVISFHSLEDRLVKQFIRVKSSVDPVFAGLPVIPPAARPVMREVGRKRRAAAAEIERNPRSRSAVLRCAEKIDAAAETDAERALRAASGSRWPRRGS
jgi:16S rRNA (cytosine1402-N4)-methyltransferase